MAEHALAGEPLVTKGLADLESAIESIEALLVSIGAPRLAALGLHVPRSLTSLEHRLYELLSEDDPDGAHSRYNALRPASRQLRTRSRVRRLADSERIRAFMRTGTGGGGSNPDSVRG